MVKIKLSYKLFTAFFLILAIVVGAMALSRYLFSLNFKNYMDQVDKERLQSLVPALKTAYQSGNSWEDLVSNPNKWRHLMNFPTERKLHGPPPRPGNAPPDGFPPPNQGPPEMPPDRSTERSPDRPPDRPPNGIFLLDAQKQPIMGEPGPNDKKNLVAIEVADEIVGWIGVYNHQGFGPPMVLLQQQTRQVFIVGGAVIALTALIAFFFSKHLLKPILQLTRGTNELASRNFTIRISPTTRDELGQLAENFNAMAYTLENYEKLRQQWLTDISHELRTPLAILQGEIEALQDGIREATSGNLASLHAEILRISKLVEDIHLLSLSDVTSLKLNIRWVDIVRLIHGVADNYQSRFQQAKIHLQMNLGAVSGVRIKGDADRLAQVFTNIFENICKYIDTPGLVTVSGQIEGPCLMLYVQDSGPGVPEEALLRLFDRLYRVDSSRNRDSGGSGLGLAICRHIIDVHGGKIWAEKSLMGGLSIIIRLALEPEEKTP